MSEEEYSEERIYERCLWDINNPGYHKYEKLEFSKIVGMQITGAVWSRWEAFICLKDSTGKRYLLYVFHSDRTSEPDFRIFEISNNSPFFNLSTCWNKRYYKKWLKTVEQEIKTFEQELKGEKK